MLSVTDKTMEIKAALLAKVGELADFIALAVGDGTPAHEVEKGLWGQMLAIGHHALGLFFQHCGEGDEGERIRLADGREAKRLGQPHVRPYLTVFGEYSLPRFVYGSREGQKIEHVPLDARLQLPAQKFSYLLQDWDQALATEQPFGKVNSSLSRILGFKQSVNSLEQTGRALSEAVQPFWDGLQPPPAGEEGKLMVVTADGKGVVMRPSELEAGKTPPQAGHPGNKKMALVGSAYTVDPYQRSADEVLAALFRDGQQERDGLPARPKPHHKRLRAALQRDGNGKTDPQSATVFAWIAQQVAQRDPRGEKPLVMVMDGQESLWNAGLEHLPEESFKVVEVLDLIHATGYVWDATHVFFPKNSPAATAYAKQQIALLLNNGVNTVIGGWRDKAVTEKLQRQAQDKLEKVCGYFTNNAHRMQYKDYLQQGFPVASGVIEGACRHVVKDRMEQSGMRWTMVGANAMLGLRSIQLSGLWDTFTQQRIRSETARLYPQLAANDDLTPVQKLA